MSSLAAYLAKNYLSASPANASDPLSERPKKRRRKDNNNKEPAAAAAEQQGLVIADDEEDLLLSGSAGATKSGRSRRAGGVEDGEGEGDVPQVYDGRVKSAEFRKKKVSAFQSVAGAVGEGGNDGGRGGEQDEADRIIVEAQRADEERRRGVEVEDAPAVVEEEGSGPRMESGVKAGLQTVEDTMRIVAREEKERQAEEKRARKEKKKKGEKQEETIYRDATGRRIDVSMKRKEARQKEIEEERARKREREEAMGDVQRRMRDEQRADLEEAKFLTVARGVDDEEMNEKLKEVVRWDDPMAAYMAQKQVAEGGTGDVVPGNSKKVSGPKKKVYQGSAPPNRYGILPGWRWDGVDRGNGFEKDWFQARSRTKRNEEMSYQWQMDE
ncbi:uncharacterized protein HMPREF1541_02085 [Cyphellophora europaea CBS 101466]|uniref:Pre-mRNA-splicing factor CWC26 n=1 Tax=Cyphellophora europaea (strain CBS 101466) TaxID=1220924 RepID=W2S2N6_CYPE1|nr:uncharacterized protein HMPREF1541_02085 [Cyphellophora europaea CBS 101466]ETN42927.1 hypothetical protein HMPREF1541_02085 [Cyphellophora europaea CBS 101466]